VKQRCPAPPPVSNPPCAGMPCRAIGADRLSGSVGDGPLQLRSRRAVYLMLALVMLFWSGNSVVARALRNDVPPFTLAFWRWGGAFLLALPFCWRLIVADRAIIRAHWPIILLLGMLGMGAFNAFFYSGLQYTTASNSLLIQAAVPALVLALDALIFRSRPLFVQIAGVLIAAAGVVAIILKGDPAVLATLTFNRGDALILCAVIVWALYTVLLRLRPPMHGMSFVGVTIAVGAIAMMGFSIAELQSHPVHLSLPVLAGVGYIILFPSLIAYFLYNLAVERIGAADVGQAVNLQPLFGALLASLVLAEPIHGYHMVGMALILIGIALPTAARARRAA